jgi:hypothetical protein
VFYPWCVVCGCPTLVLLDDAVCSAGTWHPASWHPCAHAPRLLSFLLICPAASAVLRSRSYSSLTII